MREAQDVIYVFFNDHSPSSKPSFAIKINYDELDDPDDEDEIDDATSALHNRLVEFRRHWEPLAGDGAARARWAIERGLTAPPVPPLLLEAFSHIHPEGLWARQKQMEPPTAYDVSERRRQTQGELSRIGKALRETEKISSRLREMEGKRSPAFHTKPPLFLQASDALALPQATLKKQVAELELVLQGELSKEKSYKWDRGLSGDTLRR